MTYSRSLIAVSPWVGLDAAYTTEDIQWLTEALEITDVGVLVRTTSIVRERVAVTLAFIPGVKLTGDAANPFESIITGLWTTAYDIEITDTTKGFILRSPDNNRWRLKVNNAGDLATEGPL